MTVRFSLFAFFFSVAVLGCSTETALESELTVTETAVSYGDIERTVEASATVFPFREIKVGTEVSGEVISVPVTYNSTIAVGDILAVIDPAALNSVIEQIDSQMTESRSNITLQRLQIRRAELSLETARALAQREKELLEERATSAADYERAQRGLDIAQLDLELAQVSLQSRIASLGRLQAQRSAAQTNLANATIRSPINGLVIKRNVEEGQTVQARFNSPELFVIAERRDPVELSADVAESDVWNIAPGNPVRVTATSNPSLILRGTVSDIRLTPKTKNGLTKYAVVILLDEAAPRLLPGMNASVQIVVESVQDVLRIPIDALTFTPRASERAADSDAIIIDALLRETVGSVRQALTLIQTKTTLMETVLSTVEDEGERLYASVETTASDREMTERQRDFQDYVERTLLAQIGVSEFARYKTAMMAITGLSESIVWEVDGEKLSAVPVKLGKSDRDFIEILEGLSESQQIVTGR